MLLTFDSDPSRRDVPAELVGGLAGVETRVFEERFPHVKTGNALHETQLILGLLLWQFFVVCGSKIKLQISLFLLYTRYLIYYMYEDHMHVWSVVARGGGGGGDAWGANANPPPPPP